MEIVRTMKKTFEIFKTDGQEVNIAKYCRTKASVTIVAGFSPEFDPPFLWSIKHQTKNDGIYQ